MRAPSATLNENRRASDWLKWRAQPLFERVANGRVGGGSAGFGLGGSRRVTRRVTGTVSAPLRPVQRPPASPLGTELHCSAVSR
jgi:hypothetical protein